MKKIISILALCAAVISSCVEKPQQDEAAVEYTISVSSDTLSFGPEGGNGQITITSSSDWRVVNRAEEWLTVSALEGKSGEKLDITVSENDGVTKETTLKVFSGNAVAEIYVSSLPKYYMEFIDGETYTVGQDWSQVIVNINTNIKDITYEMTGNEDGWIKVLTSGEAFGKTLFKFDVSDNTAYTDRECSVMFSGADTTITATITQLREPAVILDTTFIKYGLDAVDTDIKITTNLDCEFENGTDWITLGELEKIQELGNGLTEYNLPVQITASDKSRSGEITIRSAEPEYSATITIKQQNPNAVTAIIPDSKLRSILADAGYIFDSGDNTEVELTAEGEEATVMNVSAKSTYNGVKSLEGLEAFPNLEELDASANTLGEVDLSKMPKLKKITLSTNYNITGIFTGDSPVETIVYGDSFYTKDIVIEGKNIKSLEMIGSSFDQTFEYFRTLDVSNCPALESIDIQKHKKMTTLYVSEGQEEKINFINFPEDAEIVVK